MAELTYNPPQPQDDDSQLVINHKTAVNVSRIADAINATFNSGDEIVYVPPQPQTTDSEFDFQRKSSANISRITDTICPT